MSATTSDAPTAPGGNQPEHRPPSRLGKLFTVVFVIVLTGAAGVWWLVTDHEQAPPGDGEIVTLDPMTTAIGGGAAMHARVGIAVVLVDGTRRDVITPHLPLLEDAITAELAELSSDDLRSPDGTRRLRQQLSSRAREIWGADRVRRVLLTEVMLD